jgi:dethiobiotin synthase
MDFHGCGVIVPDMPGYFITGTDTDAGKTVAAAWMMLQLDGDYWKPTQSGLVPPTDTDRVKMITGFPTERFHRETYRLTDPLSPHEAARRDDIAIDMAAFEMPQTSRPLIVEGAGGLMVPLTPEHFVIDLIKQLSLPAVLVCRSGLGTINHTLLSLEALRTRNIDIAGIIINGPKTPHNRQALEEYGQAPVLAEIDHLKKINRDSLMAIKPETDLTKARKAA